MDVQPNECQWDIGARCPRVSVSATSVWRPQPYQRISICGFKLASVLGHFCHAAKHTKPRPRLVLKLAQKNFIYTRIKSHQSSKKADTLWCKSLTTSQCFNPKVEHTTNQVLPQISSPKSHTMDTITVRPGPGQQIHTHKFPHPEAHGAQKTQYPVVMPKTQPWMAWCPPLGLKKDAKMVVTTRNHDSGTNGLGGY